MVTYIITFTQRLLDQSYFTVSHIEELLGALSSLEPTDFEPSVQADFLSARTELRRVIANKGNIAGSLDDSIKPLIPILNAYKGKGSGGVTRQFSFLTKPVFRAIVERDYAELRLKLFPSHAWKSTVIMAGSILEAILYERLNDDRWKKAAQSCAVAGKGPIDNWSLYTMINVALKIGVLQEDPANTIHQVLRDYRNFVHPNVEVRAAHPCTEAEAMLAVGALDSVCNFLEKNAPMQEATRGVGESAIS